MDNKNEYQKQLDEEIEKRIEYMEENPQSLPKPFSKKDYIFLGISAVMCLIIVVWGAYL